MPLSCASLCSSQFHIVHQCDLVGTGTRPCTIVLQAERGKVSCKNECALLFSLAFVSLHCTAFLFKNRPFVRHGMLSIQQANCKKFDFACSQWGLELSMLGSQQEVFVSLSCEGKLKHCGRIDSKHLASHAKGQ